MKRLLMLVVACVLACGLMACSGGEKADSPKADQTQAPAAETVYEGTWTAAGLESGGTYYSREELEAKGNKNISDMYIVLQEGGKALFHNNGEDAVGEWKKTESGITLGANSLIEKDGKLLFSANGETGYFEKTSDSQEIPEAKAEDKSKAKSNKTNWKKFLKEYEEFVDEYVDLYKELKENPSDLTLISKTADLATKAAEWSKKADALEDDLSDAEAIEYAAELLKIEQKLAKALV